jgi:hypothetical protein
MGIFRMCCYKRTDSRDRTPLTESPTHTTEYTDHNNGG